MDKITINKTEYPIHVCWGAIMRFCSFKGVKDLSALDNISKLTPEDITVMFYWALDYGCKREKIENPFTYEEFEIEIEAKHVVEFVKIFSEQMRPMLESTGQSSGGGEGKKKRSLLNIFKGRR